MAFIMRAAYHADKRTFEQVIKHLDSAGNGSGKPAPKHLDRDGAKTLSLFLAGRAQKAYGG